MSSHRSLFVSSTWCIAFHQKLSTVHVDKCHSPFCLPQQKYNSCNIKLKPCTCQIQAVRFWHVDLLWASLLAVPESASFLLTAVRYKRPSRSVRTYKHHITTLILFPFVSSCIYSSNSLAANGCRDGIPRRFSLALRVRKWSYPAAETRPCLLPGSGPPPHRKLRLHTARNFNGVGSTPFNSRVWIPMTDA
jgi:hypothetical protein